MNITALLFAAVLSLGSPDGRLSVSLDAGTDGLRWSLARDGRTLVEPSPLGLRFAEREAKFGPLGPDMRILSQSTRSSDSTWTPVVYSRGSVRDHYNELTVELVENAPNALRIDPGETSPTYAPRKLTLVFRAYDEGVAFRYVVPEQEGFDGFQILEELTEWRFKDDPMAWTTSYANEFNTSQEQPYLRNRLSSLDGKKVIGMPVVVETPGASVALCEAALLNWAGLFYTAGRDGFKAHLARLPATEASTPDVAVIATTPAKSPWRVAIVGDDEVDLIRRRDILVNLNPPPDPAIDFSFVRPGATSWDWWTESNNSISTDLELRLVDFAAEMGWPYHTIDGGWYGFDRRPNHGPNVPLEPRRGFDLPRIVKHAAERGVGIWVWIHWMEIEDTGVEETFARLEKWGVRGVKTDFINRQDQWIVNWYEKVLRAAARHRIMVNFHGAFHPSGTERTWPNNLTREGILGNEMNIFHSSITPTHCLTLPFTRFLIGPGDFTPGGFGNVRSSDFVPQCRKGHRYGDATDRCPHWAEQMGTRAYALAQCIAYDSYLMTLCDWPERYRGAAGIEALRGLPTAWKATHPIAGRCGEYYAVAREAHDGRVYFAALTVKRRNLDVKLDFLDEGTWTMQVFADDAELTPADAKELAHGTREVRKGETVSFGLLDEGGAVAIFRRKSKTPPGD